MDDSCVSLCGVLVDVVVGVWMVQGSGGFVCVLWMLFCCVECNSFGV